MEEMKERPLMSEEEFKENLIKMRFSRNLAALSGTYKSVNRAFRRGHISIQGLDCPRRPFNNRKNKKMNELKKRIYAELTE